MDETKLPQFVCNYLEQAARSVMIYRGAKNGWTALYWHLHSVCLKHAGEKDGMESNSRPSVGEANAE